MTVLLVKVRTALLIWPYCYGTLNTIQFPVDIHRHREAKHFIVLRDLLGCGRRCIAGSGTTRSISEARLQQRWP